jgi:hypothetical protein
MKNTARNAIPINGTIEITSIPMELYVVKGGVSHATIVKVFDTFLNTREPSGMIVFVSAESDKLRFLKRSAVVPAQRRP